MVANQMLEGNGAEIVFTGKLYKTLHEHLFPGDHDEHGAIVAAGIVRDASGNLRLLARDLFLAHDGIDYVPGKRGYRMLRAEFIYDHIRHCREQGLTYLAIHNHNGDDYVSFSRDDLDSHKRGYPALLDVMQGLPVGALVFARNAIAGDIWLSTSERRSITKARIVGEKFSELYPSTPRGEAGALSRYERQILLFGKKGQDRLKNARIGLIGLGGVGSMLAEYLARLGVGNFVIVDNDCLEPSNYSRVVGSTVKDLPSSGISPKHQARGTRKIEIAERVIRQAQPDASVEAIFDNFAIDAVARRFLKCDFLFLAADTMQARLVFNAIVHQYLIPGIQIGTKVRPLESGEIEEAFTAVRWVLPHIGCLWCNGLISRYGLAWEGKSDNERKAQQYGTGTTNPSVITMNAVGAAHAANEFLMYFQGLATVSHESAYMHFNHLRRSRSADEPRADSNCLECGSSAGSRVARGDGSLLPTIDQASL